MIGLESMPLQHRLLGAGRQRLDGEAEALGGVSVVTSHHE